MLGLIISEGFLTRYGTRPLSFFTTVFCLMIGTLITHVQVISSLSLLMLAHFPALHVFHVVLSKNRIWLWRERRVKLS